MSSPGLLAALAVSCCACGGERIGIDLSPHERAHPSRFVGLWSIRQGVAATFYELYIDGSLRTGRSIDPGGDLEAQGGVTGWVARGPIACVFAGAWHAPSLEELAIGGACSDGAPREILLGFVEAPLLALVGDEPGWSAPPAWSFRRCPPGSDEYTCE